MPMKKFINDPENLTSELLDGYVKAYGNKVALQSEKLVVRANLKDASKVAIVTLGGAGHEPALSGFVGEGMLDISVVGDIFAAPGPPKVYEALKTANRDAGVLFVVLNHEGDVMSANTALDMANSEGFNVKMLLTHEDIAPGADAPAEDRRGLVGCVPLYKIAGAAAEAGKSLEEVYAVAEKFNNNMATLAVALKTATHPASGEAIFELADDEMEIGMGQHGEAGTGRSKMMTANETADNNRHDDGHEQDHADLPRINGRLISEQLDRERSQQRREQGDCQTIDHGDGHLPPDRTARSAS